MYVMTREQHVFGRGGPSSSRGGSPAPYVDTFLNAPDILPRHCTVRAGPEPPALVRPSRGAPVTHNGCLLLREAELHPGDLLGLGEHFLFMYKDPRAGGSGPARPSWLPARPGAAPPGPGWAFSCRLCGRGLQERGEALAAYLDGREPVLRFRPREEEALLGEIVRAAASGGGDLPPLGPATLLALCVQHSARELELGHLPRLLGRLARLIKEAVWVSTPLSYKSSGYPLSFPSSATPPVSQVISAIFLPFPINFPQSFFYFNQLVPCSSLRQEETIFSHNTLRRPEFMVFLRSVGSQSFQTR